MLVVTDGQLRLAPGMKVSIKASAGAGPASSQSDISQAEGPIQQAGDKMGISRIFIDGR